MEMIYYKHPKLLADEVRIWILYTGLCHSDVMYCRGLWGFESYPACPGHEMIGEIEAMGDEVKKFHLGDKVMVGPLRKSCRKCE